jgi:microcystin-dependent protein
MAEPYLGEIRDFGFDRVPRGWLKCDGQLLPISNNQALYSLIGTTYGGDDHTNFALPDLRGRVPLGQGQNGNIVYRMGEKNGLETTTLIPDNLPPHTHDLLATTNEADTDNPAGGALANARSNVYASPSASPPFDTELKSGSIVNAGNSLPAENRQPVLATNYCIAIQGLYPPRP